MIACLKCGGVHEKTHDCTFGEAALFVADGQGSPHPEVLIWREAWMENVLRPMIERTFAIMRERGLLPPPVG